MWPRPNPQPATSNPCGSTHRRIQWILIIFLSHGLTQRLWTLPVMMQKWVNADWLMTSIGCMGCLIGSLEDVGVAMWMGTSLWICEHLFLVDPAHHAAHLWQRMVRVVVYMAHMVMANALLCIDLVFVHTRKMRFRWDFVMLYVRERHTAAATQLEIDEQEWVVAWHHGAMLLIATIAMGWCAGVWLHVRDWDYHVWRVWQRATTRVTKQVDYERVQTQDQDDEDAATAITQDDSPHSHPSARQRLGCVLATPIILLGITIVLTKSLSTSIAMIAWNASLNEPLRVVLGIECIAHRTVELDRPLSSIIDTSTENCTFLAHDALVRHTHGFQGPLAFDVNVQPHDQPPNVLVVVVESFRQQDSLYLHQDAAVNLTPQFDAWAQRGVAFSNMWSTWRTSRSLEQILYGHVPYDSPTDSGTSTGRQDVQLSGLPQLFQAKGYNTLFTTGTRVDYDDWDVFLPTHGFDRVLDGWQLADIAADELGIDWTTGDHMMAYWGMHDDLTFDVLAHLLKTNTTNMTAPWFAMHYTISSHVPFDERPDWYDRYRQSDAFPDLSAAYRGIEDTERRQLVQNYVEMRYFTDLAFGHFMKQLDVSGVLNQTIVVVVGDHGQTPERGTAMPEEDQVRAMRVASALIAEGRLGMSAGTVIHEPTAQYDWLNTIADIVGVPPGDGFLQTGIGRSLKRTGSADFEADRRVVYSHNPALNLAVVQGSTRIEFFSDVLDVVRVFNVERDPERHVDLVRELPSARRHDILRICDEARALNAYFRTRWDHKCLLLATCEG